MRFRKLAAFAMAGAMTLSMVACTSNDESQGGNNNQGGNNKNISLVFKTLSSEYWKYMEAGAKAAAEELGVNITVLGASNESEIAQQVTQVEEQLSAGIDAIVVAPCEENAIIGALESSVGQLPIIFVDTDAALEGKTAFIGTGNQSAAKLGGVYAAEQIGKGGKAVLIGGQQGESTSAQRLKGFEEGLLEGGAVILETQFGNNTADKAMAVMEDLLTKYPGEIKAVLCMNDDMAVGCQQAIESNGVQGVTVVGFDGNTSVVELIIAGKLQATVAQQPYMMGYQAVVEANKAANGEQIESKQDVAAKLITAENAQEYLDGQKAMLGK